jgi:hypothetical protein
VQMLGYSAVAPGPTSCSMHFSHSPCPDFRRQLNVFVIFST